MRMNTMVPTNYRCSTFQSDFDQHIRTWLTEFFKAAPSIINEPYDKNADVSEKAPLSIKISSRITDPKNLNVDVAACNARLNKEAVNIFWPTTTQSAGKRRCMKVYRNKYYKILIGTRGGQYIVVDGRKLYVAH